MRKTRFLLAPIAAAVPLLAACAVGPNYHAPETKAAEKFDNLEATYSTEQGVAQFWQTFADAELDKLVNEALASNHDLRIALTRVNEARALRRDAAFDLAPSINAGGGYTKTRTSSAGHAARRIARIGALRRGLRRVLGTRLLRRRAPRARSQQRRARRRGSRAAATCR